MQRLVSTRQRRDFKTTRGRLEPQSQTHERLQHGGEVRGGEQRRRARSFEEQINAEEMSKCDAEASLAADITEKRFCAFTEIRKLNAWPLSTSNLVQSRLGQQTHKK
jgi:hypothetical protein